MSKQDSFAQILQVFGVELGGHCAWSASQENDVTIEAWVVSGRVIIIQVWPDSGWDYYLPGRVGHVDAVGEDVRKHLTALMS